METTDANSIWSSAAAYESYVGRWSRLVAREFVQWLAVPADKTWLDVGCGTGALTETLFALASPRYIVGADPSEAYVDYLRRHLTNQRLCFDVGDGRDLNFDDEFYDHTVSGLALNFVPEPRHAIAEMARVTKPGGTVAVYVWDYAGEMQMLRRFWDAAVELDPAARELDEGVRFKICKPEPLAELFRVAGLKDVAARAIDVPTVFRDFEDYWNPFLGGQGPAPSYAMSLSEARRAALREKVRAALPNASDGTIHLTARAWAVRGTRSHF
ncbi:MAG: class I SAM-dependent methyltransferase [Chloroflexota bacterium]|nr:class I SAM-dependent methyltransferase [Chloroflexota bacterium]